MSEVCSSNMVFGEPFEIVFKDETSQKQCIIKYQKENVTHAPPRE